MDDETDRVTVRTVTAVVAHRPMTETVASDVDTYRVLPCLGGANCASVLVRRLCANQGQHMPYQLPQSTFATLSSCVFISDIKWL